MSRKYLIYGGSGGIGFALARRLKEQGGGLHLVGRREAALIACAEELGATYSVGDVEDPELFQAVMEATGKELDGLAYAVGTINLGSLRRLTHEDFLADFTVNAIGAALAVKAASPALKKSSGGGSVVLFSSIAATHGFALHTSISMAKGGVEGLTVALAAELAPKIRVNAIAPSLVQTGLSESLLANSQMQQAITDQHALKKLGQPEDVAELAAYLLSSESGWLTGQIIGLDGGRSLM